MFFLEIIRSIIPLCALAMGSVFPLMCVSLLKEGVWGGSLKNKNTHTHTHKGHTRWQRTHVGDHIIALSSPHPSLSLSSLLSFVTVSKF